MNRQLLVLFFLTMFFIVTKSFSQTTLSAGDIVILEYNSDGNSAPIKFLALKDMTTNTKIKFTDNGWKSNGTFRANEGIFTWTAKANVSCGDVISIPNLSGTALSTSGDQILAYQGTSGNPTFIFAINNEGSHTWQSTASNSNNSALPTGLTNGINAVALNEIDNAKYNGILSGTKTQIRAAVCNYSNWTGNNSSNQSFSGNFTISDCGGVCITPTSQVRSISFSSVSSNSLTLNWVNGNGSSRIVKMNTANSFTNPADGTDPTADNSWNNTGEQVIYNGSLNSVTVTNLSGGTTYYFRAYEKNCSGANTKYKATTANNNPNSRITQLSNPTLMKVCQTKTTVTYSWTLPSGNYDGIMVALRQGASPPHTPSGNGNSLTANSVFGTTGTDYGSTTPKSYRVFRGTGNTVTITGLTNTTNYKLKAYTYVGTNWSTGTQSSFVSGIENVNSFNGVSQNSYITLSWVNSMSCFDEVMVVASSSPVTATPSGNGSSYTANSVFATGGSGSNMPASEYVVFKGIGNTIDVTGLTNGNTYYFKVFVRKGNEWSSGKTTSVIPTSVTVLYPGDIIFVGYDSRVGSGSGCNTNAHTDLFCMTNLVDINPGTQFLVVNASYEYSAQPNTRTDKWYSCSDAPGNYPGVLTFTWNGSNAIPKGSIISFKVTIANPFDIRINGQTTNSLNATHTGRCNISSSKSDQIYIMQGAFTHHNNTYSTFKGRVLFGLTNKAGWVGFNSTPTSRKSRLHPDLECFNIESIPNRQVTYYKRSTESGHGDHTGTRRHILKEIMDNSHWTQPTSTNCSNIPTLNQFTVLQGNSNGYWRGTMDDDWFNCENWEGLIVPNEKTDVTVPTTASNNPVIDHTKGKKYKSVAICKNLDIKGKKLTIEGDIRDTLKVFGNLTLRKDGQIDMNDGTSANDGQIYLFGNWLSYANVSRFEEGNGTVKFVAGNPQTVRNTVGTETFNNIVINNGGLNLLSSINVKGNLNLTRGIVRSSLSNLLTLLDNATYSNASQISFVDNVMRKVGNDAFVFPIGKSNRLGKLGISAPLNLTDAFTASYLNISHSHVQTAREPGIGNDSSVYREGDICTISQNPTKYLNNVSKKEYWNLERNTGNSPVYVTLFWEDGRWSQINNMSDICVAHYTNAYFPNKFLWYKEGQSGTTGDTISGSVTSGVAVNNFSSFTFGSSSPNNINPLPIELLSFDVKYNGEFVDISWVTTSEINNDFFTLEKSLNGSVFIDVERIKGAGNSNNTQYYSTTDRYVRKGTTVYYRLKQTDFDGKSDYSQIKSVLIDDEKSENYIKLSQILNNNSSEINILVETNLQGTFKLDIIDVLGKLIISKEVEVKKGKHILKINSDIFNKGAFILKLYNRDIQKKIKFVK